VRVGWRVTVYVSVMNGEIVVLTTPVMKRSAYFQEIWKTNQNGLGMKSSILLIGQLC